MTTKDKFVNHIMLDGKKSVALRIVENAFKIMKEKGIKNPEQTFQEALANVAPVLEIKAKRVGGAVYQIPMEVSEKRRATLSMRWVITAARSEKGSAMEVRLANQLMQAAENEGAAIKKKEDVHRMAEANKAFAHFARY
ncbi:MAG: 30S ribosomal protein S7 [Patescibacteria group bacterium]|nr:30S ribosomal protein S7 [Patescibacteria group bacterium]